MNVFVHYVPMCNFILIAAEALNDYQRWQMSRDDPPL